MDAIFAIRTPEQLRAISDPFRQRLLGIFATPHTVKAAAERLGVPVSRLYHHIGQLEAAGLIRVVSERKQRAATERTFQAVAASFEIADTAMPGAGPARLAFESMLAGTAETPRLGRATLRLTPERLTLLEQKLGDLLKALETPDGVETEILLLAAPRLAPTELPEG